MQNQEKIPFSETPKIYIFWRISAGPIKMYILENLNQISGKLEIHTKTQKCTYLGENIYFLQEKKICTSFSKNIRIREKIGDLILFENVIKGQKIAYFGAFRVKLKIKFSIKKNNRRGGK